MGFTPPQKLPCRKSILPETCIDTQLAGPYLNVLSQFYTHMPPLQRKAQIGSPQ